VANKGTAAIGVKITLPATPNGGHVFASGIEAEGSGKLLKVSWNGTALLVINFDGTDLVANNAIINLTGWYRT
jgi:hypothetical protein